MKIKNTLYLLIAMVSIVEFANFAAKYGILQGIALSAIFASMNITMLEIIFEMYGKVLKEGEKKWKEQKI